MVPEVLTYKPYIQWAQETLEAVSSCRETLFAVMQPQYCLLRQHTAVTRPETLEAACSCCKTLTVACGV